MGVGMAAKPAQPPTLLGQLFFAFVSPIIRVARKKGRLDYDDVPLHTTELDTAALYLSLDRVWQKHRAPQAKVLAKSLLRSRAGTLLATAVGYLIIQACSLAGPLLLGQIVAGLSCVGPSCDSQQTLYLYACGLFVAPLIQAFVENNNTYTLERVGVSFRNALMAAIYRKCLNLSNAALSTQSTGRIVTLMSNDAQKVQEFMLTIHTLWGAPLLVVAIMVLLYQEIEWGAFVGLGCSLLLMPVTVKVAGALGALRRVLIQWTDQRTSVMAEVVNGIRVIKFYAWEEPFRQKAHELRGKEGAILRKVAMLQGVFGVVLFAGPVLVGVVSFAAYTAAGNELTTAALYTALALFTLLRFPLGFLPAVIQNGVNAMISLGRIARFLVLDEVSSDESWYHSDVMRGVVTVTEGSFKWDTEASDAEATLRGIDLTCLPGQVTMIVGAVGCGKSSLLSAILRQMIRVSGDVAVGGRIAYVPQTAWIMNETVRENVLMGSALDELRYKHALTVAQLASDLELLPDGDLTEIGERGVTLSGGQKQRVSLARAVYADADVVILDDPLSAVDAHVGRAIFEDLICGALRTKTVLLVTNALHFVHLADQVVWLSAGRVRAVGSYETVAADAAFAELVGGHIVAEDVDTGGGDGKGGQGARKPKNKAEEAVANMKVSSTDKNLTGNEDRSSGAVSKAVLGAYIVAGGGALWLTGLIILHASETGTKIFTDAWLGFYTDDPPRGKFNQSLAFYLSIYAGLAVTFGIITFFRSISFTFGAVRAAVNLHIQLVDRVLRMPVAFFDTNPSGRIINRFSRDTDIMDSVLPLSLSQIGVCSAQYVGILIVISVATPWFILMLPPITVVYLILQRYYIPGARELQRLEAVTRSPVYSGFSEAVNGLPTIRAFHRQAHFTSLEDRLIAENGLVYLTQRAGAAWLSIRLDFIGLIVLTTAGVLAVASDINPQLAGLSLTYALELTKYLKFGTRVASKTESDFNSVERVVQYLHEEEEAPAFQDDDPPPEKWPSKGCIAVSKAVMRYRPHLPVVLKSVSFEVESDAHIGIVGRTGSGKSSLFLVLFRLIELESGSVTIDGREISSLGLTTLRRGLSMIPQDPFMFSGTVRRNLDPFGQYSDAEVWHALEQVNLKPTISGLEDKLEAMVTDNGGNYSQGQRQLFCLARALLRKSRILMLDEATASVDLDTDQLIQAVVRKTFRECTVLTIAHRLNTIMDSDKVLVMDGGQAAEYETAHELLKRPDSLFARLVENTGANAAARLKHMASQSHLASLAGGGGATTQLPALAIGGGATTGASSSASSLPSEGLALHVGLDDAARPPLAQGAPELLELSPRSTETPESGGGYGEAGGPGSWAAASVYQTAPGSVTLGQGEGTGVAPPLDSDIAQQSEAPRGVDAGGVHRPLPGDVGADRPDAAPGRIV